MPASVMTFEFSILIYGIYIRFSNESIRKMPSKSLKIITKIHGKYPYKLYGFVRVKYGFRTGKVRVWKMYGFDPNTRYVDYCTGLYGQSTGTVRVKYGFRVVNRPNPKISP